MLGGAYLFDRDFKPLPLGINVGTVKSRMRLALERMRVVAGELGLEA